MAVWNPKANEIFLNAVELSSPEERQALLECECGSDATLRDQVERLLQAHESASSFLQQPAPECAPTLVYEQGSTNAVNSRIGPYKLLQTIGEGGMGTVYMAEQLEPVRRKVALKVIKPGMDTRQVIARFEAERQALSLMDHPHIAKVLDAGTTETGRPYFVMELVKGQPITQYCDEHHLTPRQRLELLLPVCQAIQHAHQKGIIHRDIKPSNILVAEYDQKPVPKVIDFGVAKATSQPLTEMTMFTGYGQIIGTLEYMSPEQAKVNQLDVDTRSDIYSLGVLLYELLTGTTPFDKQRLRSAAWDEMLRIIREEEPPKPSTRLSDAHNSLPSISAQRQMEPAKLTKLVRGELDWIVMKALEKDRARRYETASAFATDLQHYLDDEPVQACPPSGAYRLRKFVRRNSGVLIAMLLIGSSLVAGTAVSTWQAIRATTAEAEATTEARRANREAENARQQERKATQNLSLANQEKQRAETALDQVTAEQQRAEGNLDLALQALDAVYLHAIGTEKLLGTPLARPDGHAVIQKAKAPLSDLEKDLLRRGLAFYDQFTQQNAATPKAALLTAQAYYRVGLLHAGLNDSEAAVSAYKAAIQRFEQLTQQQPANADHWRQLGYVYNTYSLLIPDWSETKKTIHSAITAFTKAIAIQPADARSFAERAKLHGRLENFSAAIADIEGAVALNPQDRWHRADAAFLYQKSFGKDGVDSRKAFEHLEHLLAMDAASWENRFALAIYLSDRGSKGDMQRATEYFNEVVESQPKNVSVLSRRARHHHRLGNLSVARKDLNAAREIETDDFVSLIDRAVVSLLFEDLAGAKRDLDKAKEIQPNNPELFHQRCELHAREGRWDAALAEINACCTMYPGSPFSYKRRGQAHFNLGNFAESLRDFQKAMALRPSDLSALTWIPPAQVATCPDQAFKDGLLQLATDTVAKNPAARSHRAVLALHLGRLDIAREDLAEIINSKGNQATHYDLYQVAMLHLADNRNVEAYRAACREMAGRFVDSKDADALAFMGWVCALMPDTLEVYAPVLSAVQRASDATPDRSDLRRTLGALQYRDKQFEAALKTLQPFGITGDTPVDPKTSHAYPLFFLSMTQHRLGQLAAAKASLMRAMELADGEFARPDTLPWNRKLTLELLRDEAISIIGPVAPIPPPPALPEPTS